MANRSKSIWPTRTKNEREVQAYRRQQNDDNFSKANKINGGTENNVVTLDSSGDIKDSGVAISSVKLREENKVYVSADYNVTENDEIVYVKCSTVDITVTLPASSDRTFIVQKIDSTSNKVIVVGQTGETINSDSSFEILWQYESIEPTKVNKAFTGTDWLI